MDVVNSPNLIRITHYINPHMFWYVHKSDCPSPELMKLELQINLHFIEEAKTQHNTKYKPKTGEIAAVYDCNKRNYIRVQVDRILELGHEVKCCLWAIDYGVIYNSSVKWMRKLPSEFQTTDLGLIKFAGLQGIAPAELKYDYEEQENKMVLSENWSARAVEVVKNIIDDAEEITFKVELVAPNRQEFGNITVETNKRINVNLIESLIKSQAAVRAPNFMTILPELKTNCINRYEDNERRVNLNFHENRYNGALNAVRQPSDGVAEAPGALEMHPDLVCDTEEVIDKVSHWNQRNEEWKKRQKAPISDNERPALVPAKVLNEPAPSYRSNNPFVQITMCQQIMALRSNVPRKPRGAVDGVMNMLKEARDKAALDSSSDGQSRSASEIMLQMCRNKKTATAKSMPKLPAKTTLNFLPAGADVNASQRKKPVRPVHVPDSSSSNGVAHDSNNRRSGEKRSYNPPSNNFSKALVEERCMPNYLSDQRVLVHGKQSEKPVALANANFTIDVVGRMQAQKIAQFYRIQTHAWPNIMRGRSIVVVNSHQTGKTWCYVPAIVSLIQYAKEEEEAIIEGSGPIAIVVCPSSHRAERLKSLMNSFRMDTVVAFGVRHLENVLGRLLNGCDILVTTPRAFKRLYDMDRNVFVGRRIKHLVFDDMDTALDNFAADLETIFTLCRQGNKDDFQLVVTSKMWRPVYTRLIDLCDAVLCIGAYIEAAAYGQCEFKLKLVESHKKMAMIKSQYVTNGQYEAEKTIIVCNNREEVVQLVEQLKAVGVLCLWAHEDTNKEDLVQLESWNNDTKDKSLMVCSDDVLSALKVNKAKNLIHFSMPSLWSVFCLRFAVFFGTYVDYTDAEKRNAANKQNPSTFVLLDEKNSDSLPRLIEFLNKHYNTDVKENILKLSKNIQIHRELAKRQGNNLQPLCSNFLEFARCFNKSECTDRHVFTSFDLSKRPFTGMVKLHILEINSPVHYAARITHQYVDAAWQPVRDNFLAFSCGLDTHFSNSTNQISHYPVCLGDICVIPNDEGSGFSRCEVLRIKKETALRSTNSRVTVKLIDSGRVLSCSSSELLAVPPEYQEFPAQAVDVRLTGIVPLDFETEWSRNALGTIRSWMRFDDEDDEKHGKVSLQAHVRLCMRNTIWVDSLVLVEALTAINRHTKTDLRASLVNKQFCQKDDNAIEKLAEMILEVELSEAVKAAPAPQQPGKAETKAENLSSSSLCESDETTEPERAFSTSIPSDEAEYANVLEKNEEEVTKEEEEAIVEVVSPVKAVESWCVIDDIECHNISLSYFESPSSFYVQRGDQLQGLIQLNDAIMKFLKSTADMALQHLEVGTNCLVDFDEVISRAKVIELIDDLKVKLLLLDLGETAIYGRDELMKTSHQIVEMLPYLAIQCNMIGIRPKEGDRWTDDVANDVYDEIIAPCKSLFVRVIQNNSNPVPIDGMASYDVLLIDCTNEKQDVKINKKIIDEGYAARDPDSEHFMDLIVSKRKHIFLVSTDSDDASNEDSDQDWDKHCKGKKRSKNILNTEAHEKLDYGDDYQMEICFSDDEVEGLTRAAYPNAPDNFKIDEARKLQAADGEAKEDAMIREIKNASELNVVFDKKDSTLDSDDLTDPQSAVGESEHADMPRLLVKHKYAKTQWQQNESMVRLEISATDIKAYSLWVSNEVLQYIHKYADDSKPDEILNINLFGCIEPKWTSHEHRGLNVIVRLVKTMKGHAWPTLMFPEQKPLWLKFNLNSITVAEVPEMPKIEMLPAISLNQEDSDFEVITDGSEDDDNNFVDVYGD